MSSCSWINLGVGIGRQAFTAAFVLWAGVFFAPPALAQTAIFQNGATAPFGGGTYTGAQDTMIVVNNSVGQTDINFGARTHFEIGTFTESSPRHSLIRFDLTSMAGQFDMITGVTLRLTFTDQLNGLVSTSNTVEVHRVSAANTGWVEGTSVGTVGTGGQSTWDFRNQSGSGSGTPWAGAAGASTPGTDFLAATIAGTAWNGAPPAGTTFDLVFTDTSFLTGWIGGTNSGLFLKNATETMSIENRVSFYSSDFSTVGFRPQLLVTYTAITAIPEPSSLALLLGLCALGGKFFFGRVSLGCCKLRR